MCQYWCRNFPPHLPMDWRDRVFDFRCVNRCAIFRTFSCALAAFFPWSSSDCLTNSFKAEICAWNVNGMALDEMVRRLWFSAEWLTCCWLKLCCKSAKLPCVESIDAWSFDSIFVNVQFIRIHNRRTPRLYWEIAHQSTSKRYKQRD